MKEKLVRCLVVFLTVVLAFNAFVPIGMATDSKAKQKEVDQLAQQLEFIFEEAAITETNGAIVGFDVEKIEEEYGANKELDMFKEDLDAMGMAKNQLGIEQSKQENLITPNALVIEFDEACLRRELRSILGNFIPVAAMTIGIQYMVERKYVQAANTFIRAGFRGSVYALAAQLGWIGIKCALE